jgi:cytochrome c-type biogenesis protein CcmE
MPWHQARRVPGAPHAAPGIVSKPTSRVLKIFVSVAVVVLAIAVMRFSARGHTSRYKMVDEVTVAPAQWTGAPLQVHGFVEPGSIDERVVNQETVRTFVLEHRGQRLRVRNKGPAPDSFRDRAEVVADGRLLIENGTPVLEATNLMAKCPSKYHGVKKDRLFDGP